MLPRETIAYCLMTVLAVGGAVWGSIAWRRYTRRKLRRQGIKRYGH